MDYNISVIDHQGAVVLTITVYGISKDRLEQQMKALRLVYSLCKVKSEEI